MGRFSGGQGKGLAGWQKIVKERINIPLDAINIIGIGLLLYGAGVLSHSIGIVLLYFRLAEHSLHIDCSHKKREDAYNIDDSHNGAVLNEHGHKGKNGGKRNAH